jgi:hypothetical protein
MYFFYVELSFINEILSYNYGLVCLSYFGCGKLH